MHLSIQEHHCFWSPIFFDRLSHHGANYFSLGVCKIKLKNQLIWISILMTRQRTITKTKESFFPLPLHLVWINKKAFTFFSQSKVICYKIDKRMTLLSTRSAMFAKGLSPYMVWLKHRWHDSMSKTVPNEKKGKFVKKNPAVKCSQSLPYTSMLSRLALSFFFF